MAIITIQIGQCGNQIGSQFFSSLFEECSISSESLQQVTMSKYFTENIKKQTIHPNAILIDMESKVVNKCLQMDGPMRYEASNAFWGQCGSGNNWAYGNTVVANMLKKDIDEKIGGILDKYNCIDGFIIIQSLAGGTGSGLGSYVTEYINDMDLNRPIVNITVWPHSTGEVNVQNYNTMLTMKKIDENSDGTIIFDNDDILTICEQLLKIKKPDFYSMNRVIAHMLKSVFLPCTSSKYYTSTNYLLQDIKSRLLQDPSYKLLNIKSVPQISQKSKSFVCDTWDGIIKRIFQMILSNSNESLVNWKVKSDTKNANKCISQMLLLRGKYLSMDSIETVPLSGKVYENFDSHYLDGVERTASCIQ